MTFKYKIGHSYETQAGNIVTVLNRTYLVGYECLICSDGRHRYDRSTHSDDAGRVTGTAGDYSYPHNFVREDKLSFAQKIEIFEHASKREGSEFGDVLESICCLWYNRDLLSEEFAKALEKEINELLEECQQIVKE